MGDVRVKTKPALDDELMFFRSLLRFLASSTVERRVGAIFPPERSIHAHIGITPQSSPHLPARDASNSAFGNFKKGTRRGSDVANELNRAKPKVPLFFLDKPLSLLVSRSYPPSREKCARELMLLQGKDLRPTPRKGLSFLWFFFVA